MTPTLQEEIDALADEIVAGFRSLDDLGEGHGRRVFRQLPEPAFRRERERLGLCAGGTSAMQEIGV